MSQFIDYLFTLDGFKQEIFHAIIRWINSTLKEDSTATGRLVEILKSDQDVNSIFQQYDLKSVNTILEAIIKVLEDNNSIPILVNKVDDYYCRYFAATMLGWFGSKARVAIPQLVSLASGSSGEVGAAKQSIILIGHAESEVMSALRLSVLENDDGEFRELCDLAVKAGYHSGTDFLDILKMAAQNNNSDLREAVADTIWKLDTSSKQLLTSVLDQLKNDPNDNVKRAAIEASQ